MPFISHTLPLRGDVHSELPVEGLPANFMVKCGPDHSHRGAIGGDTPSFMGATPSVMGGLPLR